MIMDSTLEMLDAVALNTGAPGTYLLGNQIDTAITGFISPKNVGLGRPVYLVISVDTTATSSGAATLQLILASDDSAAISTTTATEHWKSDEIPVAQLTAGKYFVVPLPMSGTLSTYERFLGILQVTGTAAFTGGKLNAFLTFDPFGWTAQADATN